MLSDEELRERRAAFAMSLLGCRVTRAVPQTPIYDLGHYRCPLCGTVVQLYSGYCHKWRDEDGSCFQAIDWRGIR